jgi:hypothetical protein
LRRTAAIVPAPDEGRDMAAGDGHRRPLLLRARDRRALDLARGRDAARPVRRATRRTRRRARPRARPRRNRSTAAFGAARVGGSAHVRARPGCRCSARIRRLLVSGGSPARVEQGSRPRRRWRSCWRAPWTGLPFPSDALERGVTPHALSPVRFRTV